MSKKYQIDIGTENVTVFGELPCLKEPSCVVLKKGLFNRAVAVGVEAKAMGGRLKSDEYLIYPVTDGGIKHFSGAVLMARGILSKAGVKKSDEVTAVVPCCYGSEQKADVERVILEAGYKNLTLVDSLNIFAPAAEKRGAVTVVNIGASHTELGIVDTDGIVTAYSLDIGGRTVDELIKKKVERLYKLTVTSAVAEEIKLNVGSLYKKDKSAIVAAGVDIVTGERKSVTVYAKDIYADIVYCYARIFKAIEAMLNDAPIKCLEDIDKKGVLFGGGGTRMDGFSDYVYATLCLGATVTDR